MTTQLSANPEMSTIFINKNAANLHGDIDDVSTECLASAAGLALNMAMKTIIRPLILLLLLCCGPVFAGGKSSGPSIGFHPEGDESEGARMVRRDPSFTAPERWFRISPEISTRHVNAFAPFPAADGSFGAALHLTDEGMRARNVMCNTYSGKLLRIIVNGRPVDTIKIDHSPANEPYIVIWRGLSQKDLDLMSKKLKRIEKKE